MKSNHKRLRRISVRAALAHLLFAAGLLASGPGWAAKDDFEVLHQFDMATEGRGASPLVEGPDGRFYGTNGADGPHSGGTVYAVDKHGVVTVLHAFNLWTEGSSPGGRLLFASDGGLYGTLAHGGANGCGAIYRLSLSDGAIRRIHSFTVANGCTPVAGLVQGKDGALYGTTMAGGLYQWGTVFRWDQRNKLRVLMHLNLAAGEGGMPRAGLTLSADGLTLFGTTWRGGERDSGTLFSLATDGAGFRVVHSFGDAIGEFPAGGLLLAKDGSLYGSVSYGGPALHGALYRMTPDGEASVQCAFRSFGEAGTNPAGSLTAGHHGRLYGATAYGGVGGGGTVFACNPDGSFVVLHSFFSNDDEVGQGPGGGLVAAHGYLYGATTTRDTDNQPGAVFRVRKLAP